jgi:hypothetical protein
MRPIHPPPRSVNRGGAASWAKFHQNRKMEVVEVDRAMPAGVTGGEALSGPVDGDDARVQANVGAPPAVGHCSSMYWADSPTTRRASRSLLPRETRVQNAGNQTAWLSFPLVISNLSDDDTQLSSVSV